MFAYHKRSTLLGRIVSYKEKSFVILALVVEQKIVVVILLTLFL
jgi:hypothetical protein